MPQATLLDSPTIGEITLTTYSDEMLPELVSFWNTKFAGRHNFFRLTPAMFRERVIDKHYIEEPLDPEGLILAVDADSSMVVGMIHCGLRSERFCRAAYGDWDGGSEAYIAIIAVADTHGRNGIGTKLWNAAVSYVENKSPGSRIMIDSKCLNPYYGNSDGLYTPPWGTTEGIAIEWDDEPTRNFLAARGFQPKSKAVSMELLLNAFRPFPSGAESLLGERGLSLTWLDNRSPILGGHVDDTLVTGTGSMCGAICCVDGDHVVGLLSVYPMVELNANKVAIYDFETLEDYRGLGIGKAILWKLLRQLRDLGAETCEVLTIPGVSPRAYVLYGQAGFRQVAEWVVY